MKILFFWVVNITYDELRFFVSPKERVRKKVKKKQKKNSVWYGSSDSFKMAPPESCKVQYSLLSKILAEEGPPPKIEEKK